MSMGWRWRDEVREDGLWESSWRFWGARVLALPMIAFAAFMHRRDGWMLGGLAVFAVAWLATVWSSRASDRPLFGLSSQSSSLVAGQERLELRNIDRLTVRGPLARREVVAYLWNGTSTTLLKGWSAQRRALAEQWLIQRQHSLPFPVAIEAPESPFLQPDTLI